MTLNKIEVTGFDYIMGNVFSSVVSECNSEIGKILSGNQDLSSKIEEKLDRIMKNRAIKKAVNAKLIVEEEKSKEFSGGQIIVNAKIGFTDKLRGKFESNFTFIDSKHHDFISDSSLHVYNRDASKPLRRYAYSAVKLIGKNVASYDTEDTISDLALAN